MNKTVRLKMIGKQAEGEIVEIDTAATYAIRDGVHFVSYLETSKDSCMPTETVLQFKKDRLTIIKKGEVNSKMEFEQGKKLRNDYMTPYASFLMETVTTTFSLSFREDGIEGFVGYELFIDGGKISDSEVSLKIIF